MSKSKKTNDAEETLSKAIANMEYSGHSIKPNGVIDLTLKADYSQLGEVLKITTMIAQMIKVKIKAGTKKPFLAGVMRFKSLSVNESGIITIKVYGAVASSDIQGIAGLIEIDRDDDQMVVCFEHDDNDEGVDV